MAVHVKFDREKLMGTLRRAFAEGVTEVSLRVQEELVDIISYPGKGPMGKLNPQSLPGDPPARQTGALRRSWRTGIKRSRVFGNTVTLRVGSDPLEAPYARWLEYGTRRMAKRPYVSRAIIAVRDFDRPTAAEIMTITVSKALKRYGGIAKVRST